ncbi:MAG: hypothetical protein HC769_35000 [Cyanobacteria bacterium CRU_2_1]|nr:hypothetical protein [Cyanobacteria bacterium CRU_2_1]
MITFQTRPPLNPLLYPYLEWLIAENSYLKMSGIMQVNRQVDLFLDQIYVSLQAERRQQVTETSLRVERQRVSTPRGTGRSRAEREDEPGILYDNESLEDELIELQTDGIEISTKTVIERVDLANVVQNHAYSVILGAPGAGKTTLLRYLALHYAKPNEMDSIRSWVAVKKTWERFAYPFLFGLLTMPNGWKISLI